MERDEKLKQFLKLLQNIFTFVIDQKLITYEIYEKLNTYFSKIVGKLMIINFLIYLEKLLSFPFILEKFFFTIYLKKIYL